MTVALGLLASALLYAWGFARAAAARRNVRALSAAAFVAALAAFGAALLGPVESRSDTSLVWHMLQHLLLIDVAAPLLLLGAPVRVALAALPQRPAAALARVLVAPPLRVVAHPACAWLQFVAVLYGAHFSPLYEASLESAGVHFGEHLLFLVSAAIFWSPLLAVAPAPHAPSHPVRLLAVFLALPMSAFLGFAFYVTNHVLYAHYALGAGALADQRNAGALMWIAGGAPLFVVLLWLVADWGARERRYGAIADGRLP